ncbi:MAG TPA: hypothetical protein VFN99_11375 [Gaiella sp.]|nr:hypothetical protein [Gaiella sp.]
MGAATMRRRLRRFALPLVALLGAVAIATVTAGTTQAGSTGSMANDHRVIDASAYDVSKPLRELAKSAKPSGTVPATRRGADPIVIERSTGESAATASVTSSFSTMAVGPTLANFEGLSNQDNFNVFGFRVNPPDPVGDVGPNHYVEMINLVFAVYSKTGTKLLGPVDTGTLWDDFPIEDCTDPSGDPIVVYDQFADRWLLSQFTTRGLADPTLPFYNCVAVSQTGDPTGAYHRYAFITQPDTDDGGYFFPDYPKYGVWKDSYVLTTRDFGAVDEYGISIYALDRNKMVEGDPNARAVQFFLDSRNVPLEDIGDGLLPADVDGKTKPKQDVPIPIVGTQDDDVPYGATVDAINIWELDVHWNANAQPNATLTGPIELPVAEFDSNYPCGPTRGCLPQPGIANPDQWLDILSYRQRPTWRLAWRAFKGYDSMVTAQSVEASPSMAGMRWYEIRRNSATGVYTVHQQGTYAPNDGVHRWMGSIAQDKNGAMALGYSVVNGTTVFPGIRYTGRVASDPLGTMPQGEAVVINGTGVQTTTNSRWGDYTSMNVDPADDCTFWYVNEYYEVSGLPLPLPAPPLPPPGTTAPWQTRIASFKLPGC